MAEASPDVVGMALLPSQEIRPSLRSSEARQQDSAFGAGIGQLHGR